MYKRQIITMLKLCVYTEPSDGRGRVAYAEFQAITGRHGNFLSQHRYNEYINRLTTLLETRK